MDGDAAARKLSAVVAADGVINLPPEAATRLGAQPGDFVEIDLDAFEGVRVVRVPTEPQEPVSFAKFVGIGRLPNGMSTDDYMAMIRDPIDG